MLEIFTKPSFCETQSKTCKSSLRGLRVELGLLGFLSDKPLRNLIRGFPI